MGSVKVAKKAVKKTRKRTARSTKKVVKASAKVAKKVGRELDPTEVGAAVVTGVATKDPRVVAVPVVAAAKRAATKDK